jgi:hypothetical protein
MWFSTIDLTHLVTGTLDDGVALTQQLPRLQEMHVVRSSHEVKPYYPNTAHAGGCSRWRQKLGRRISPCQGTLGAPYLPTHLLGDMGHHESQPSAHEGQIGPFDEDRKLASVARWYPTSRTKDVRDPNFLYAGPPSPACAALIRESRMNLVEPTGRDRNSGIWGTRP